MIFLMVPIGNSGAQQLPCLVAEHNVICLLMFGIFFLQDTFFYCLVFDPTQKTLLADKGEIRVGSRYQTEMTTFLKEGEFFFLINYSLLSQPQYHLTYSIFIGLEMRLLN